MVMSITRTHCESNSYVPCSKFNPNVRLIASIMARFIKDYRSSPIETKIEGLVIPRNTRDPPSVNRFVKYRQPADGS